MYGMSIGTSSRKGAVGTARQRLQRPGFVRRHSDLLVSPRTEPEFAPTDMAGWVGQVSLACAHRLSVAVRRDELMSEQMPSGRRRGIESSRRKRDVVSEREGLQVHRPSGFRCGPGRVDTHAPDKWPGKKRPPI